MAVRAWWSMLVTGAGWGGGRGCAGKSEAGGISHHSGGCCSTASACEWSLLPEPPCSQGELVWMECNQLVTPFVQRDTADRLPGRRKGHQLALSVPCPLVTVHGLCGWGAGWGCPAHTWNLLLFLQQQRLGQRPSCGFISHLPFPTSPQVFVWVGKDSQEEEKTDALASGEDPRVPAGLFRAVGGSSFCVRVWEFVTAGRGLPPPRPAAGEPSLGGERTASSWRSRRSHQEEEAGRSCFGFPGCPGTNHIGI